MPFGLITTLWSLMMGENTKEVEERFTLPGLGLRKENVGCSERLIRELGIKI